MTVWIKRLIAAALRIACARACPIDPLSMVAARYAAPSMPEGS